jgi:hypothetical protein
MVVEISTAGVRGCAAGAVAAAGSIVGITGEVSSPASLMLILGVDGGMITGAEFD